VISDSIDAGVSAYLGRDLVFATTAHARHREPLRPTACSSANRGPDGCKHRSSHVSADPSFCNRPYGGCRPAWCVDIGRSPAMRSWGLLAVRVAPRAASTTA
jgi:hypothetical protein